MNLVKNVDGDWVQAKNRLRADLDTVQRTINQILAQINAPVATVPVPAATITPAGHVTVPTGVFLSTVSVGAGLSGDGTVVNPLVNTGVASVAAAGALTGDGSSGSPLAVAVDGVTVTIVGNQLVAGGSGATVNHVKSADFAANINAATPITIIPAPAAGFVTIPIMGMATISVDSFVSTQDINLQYVGYGFRPVLTFGAIIPGGGTSRGYWFATNSNSNFRYVTEDVSAKAMECVFTAGNSYAGGSVHTFDTLTVAVWYLTAPL